MRWLVVAHEKEIPDLANLERTGWKVVVLGVGQFASLANFAHLAAKEKPSGVLLLGTAGAQNEKLIGKIFHCSHFTMPQIENEELPEIMEVTAATTPAIDAGLFSSATVLQNAGVSIDAKKFEQNLGYVPPAFPRPVLENMEALSLALYCAKEKISFSALLQVTNAIGPEGRRQWRTNFKAAGVALRAAAVREIQRTIFE